MRMKTIFTAAGILFFTAAALSASGASEETAVDDYYSGTEGRITVYLSGPDEMIKKLEQGFEAERGDVLDIVLMGCGPLRQRVWAEAVSGQIKADVIWGSDPLLYNVLEKNGYLEKIELRNEDEIKPEYIPDHDYYFVNERYGVVIYNRELAEEKGIPSSFADLKSPVYDNYLVMADPAQSSTALALVCGLWELNNCDWEYFDALAENRMMLVKKNSDVPSKVQEGEFILGVAPHDAVLRLKAKAKKEGYPIPLEICWPEEGALAIQRPIAVSRNSARPEANVRLAEDFVNYMLSGKAQEITVKFGFMGVRKDSEVPKGIPADLKIANLDWDSLSENENTIRENFKNIFN